MIYSETDKSFIKKWLAHPLTRGWSIDDPRTTELRKLLIVKKKFLRRIYIEWYKSIVSELPKLDGLVLELGSGAGFLRDFIPGLVTSEILPCPDVDIILDGYKLPFPDNSLRGIVMPGWSFGIWRGMEKLLKPWMEYFAMFARITLLKSNNN